MNDPVLMSRLEALWHNLNVVNEKLRSSAWRSEPPRSDTRAEMLVESLWTGLETTLIRQIEAQQKLLKDEERKLSSAAAGDDAAVRAGWVNYHKILRNSQGLLRECLEIIGTLAIRQTDLDQRILYVADELIRDCLQLSTGDDFYYLLVHGLEDTFAKTRARIIRLRFPEWTIWDLPLAAHELGHVVIAETLIKEERDYPGDPDLQVLTSFLGKQRDSLVGQDAELNQKHQLGGDQATEAERWAENRVRIFLADAFAVYTMGPAYACSAIMLRLSPSIGAQGERPSDAQRAHVVLSMLRWMNDSVPIPRPYTDIIQMLETCWETTLERGSPVSSKLSNSDKVYLAQMVDLFGREVSPGFLRRAALYPHQPTNDGWKRAQEWCNGWLSQWNAVQPLTSPANPAGKLRDVLNAAWLGRLLLTLQLGGDVAAEGRAFGSLAEAGQSLCKAIIRARTGGVQPPVAATAAQGEIR